MFLLLLKLWPNHHHHHYSWPSSNIIYNNIYYWSGLIILYGWPICNWPPAHHYNHRTSFIHRLDQCGLWWLCQRWWWWWPSSQLIYNSELRTRSNWFSFFFFNLNQKSFVSLSQFLFFIFLLYVIISVIYFSLHLIYLTFIEMATYFFENIMCVFLVTVYLFIFFLKNR